MSDFDFNDDIEDFDDTSVYGKNNFPDIDEPDGPSILEPTDDVEIEAMRLGKQDFLNDDYPGAVHHFEKAVNEGEPRGYYFLGLMQNEGLGCKANLEEGSRLWRVGAKQGDLLCALCTMDADDFDDAYGDADEDEAQEVLAIAEKDSFFAYQLVKLNKEYDSTLIDGSKVLGYLESAKNDRRGNILAMYYLYDFYKGDHKDDLAKACLEEAASRRYPKAMIKLGQLYENGLDGYPRDDEKALSWFVLALDAKCKEANEHVGRIYFNRGEYNTAFVNIKRAAKDDSAESMVRLGRMYQNGWGTKINIDKAVEWYTKAKEQGSEDAAKYLLDLAGGPKGATNLAAKAATVVATNVIGGAAGNVVGGIVGNAVGKVAGNVVAGAVTDAIADTVGQVVGDAVGGAVGDAVGGAVTGKFNEVISGGGGNSVSYVSHGAAITQGPVNPEPKCATLVKNMIAAGLAHRDAAKKLINELIAGQDVACWKFYPKIDSKSIVLANNNYAGKNLPFDVVAVFDDAVLPVFKGKTGILLAVKKFAASSCCNVPIASVVDIKINGKTMDIICDDGMEYRFNAKKAFVQENLVKDLILGLALMARLY